MTYLKITAVFLLLLFIMWWLFYLWVIDSLKLLVTESNNNFIAFLPPEWIAILILITFSILGGLAYSFYWE